MYCPKCGKECKAGAVYCTMCGNKLVNVQDKQSDCNETSDKLNGVFGKSKEFFKRCIGVLIIVIIVIIAFGGLLSLGLRKDNEEDSHKKEENVEIHKCIWSDGTCIEEQKCEICGEANGNYGQHLIGEDGVCVYCNEFLSTELNLSNFEEYLNIDAGCYTTWGRVEIDIESIKEVKYTDAVVTLEVYFLDRLMGSATETVTIELDSQGNGSDYVLYDAPVKYKGKNPALSDYSVTIVNVEGSVTN